MYYISLTGDNKIQLLETWQGHLEPPVDQQASMNRYNQQAHSYASFFIYQLASTVCFAYYNNKKLGNEAWVHGKNLTAVVSFKISLTTLGVILMLHDQCGNHCYIHVPCSPQQSL